jgi:hypothetical protein
MLSSARALSKDDETGEVTEVHCTYDPATQVWHHSHGRKIKSTIHWVSAKHAIEAEVRLYESPFPKANPSDSKDGRISNTTSTGFFGSFKRLQAGTVYERC